MARMIGSAKHMAVVWVTQAKTSKSR